MVWYADEYDARTDLGLHTLHKQVEQRAIPYIRHHEAARLYPRLNAAFSTNLPRLFRRSRKPEGGRSAQTRHRYNCHEVHSPSLFCRICGAVHDAPSAAYAALERSVESKARAQFARWPIFMYFAGSVRLGLSAKVAELADAPDLGSGGETHEGSSPSFRTNNLQLFAKWSTMTCA